MKKKIVNSVVNTRSELADSVPPLDLTVSNGIEGHFRQVIVKQGQSLA